MNLFLICFCVVVVFQLHRIVVKLYEPPKYSPSKADPDKVSQ
jgi:hypothetical protein